MWKLLTKKKTTMNNYFQLSCDSVCRTFLLIAAPLFDTFSYCFALRMEVRNELELHEYFLTQRQLQ